MAYIIVKIFKGKEMGCVGSIYEQEEKATIICNELNTKSPSKGILKYKVIETLI